MALTLKNRFVMRHISPNRLSFSVTLTPVLRSKFILLRELPELSDDCKLTLLPIYSLHTDGFPMSGALAVKYAVAAVVRGSSSALRRIMVHVIAYPTRPAVAIDRRYRRRATRMNVRNGKSMTGRGWVNFFLFFCAGFLRGWWDGHNIIAGPRRLFLSFLLSRWN